MSPTPPLQIEVETLRAALDDGAEITLLDVREPWEVDICAIGGSINLPLQRLPDGVDRLDRDKPLIVLCHHGMRSLQAVMWLRRNGFDKASNLSGGIDAWARRVDPSMPVY